MAETVVINQGLEERTSPTGKTRFTIKVTAEPLRHTFDAKELGRGPAEAIVKVLQEKMRAISAAAAPATLRARRSAAKALAAGKSWALQRYGGGRIGSKPPNQSMTKFDDSGRFRDSLVASASKDNAWRINVAANRLDPRTTRGVAGVQAIWSQLVSLVPEFGDPGRLLADFQVRRAIAESTRQIIHKARATANASALELVRTVADRVEQLDDIASGD